MDQQLFAPIRTNHNRSGLLFWNALALVAFIIWTVFIPSSAFSQIKIDLRTGKGSNQNQLNWPASHKWEWLTNDDRVRVLTSRVAISLPTGQGFRAAKAAPETTRVRVVDSKLTAQMQSLQSRILVGGSRGRQTFDVRLTTSRGEIIDENCAQNLVRLYPETKDFPFYLGTSCQGQQGRNLTLTLSFPQEVELEKSSLFEAKGKGEPWRHYEVGNVKAASGEIGRFTFKYKGKSYSFSFESLRAETKKDQPQQAGRIGLGLNFSQLAIKGVDIEAADSKPGFSVKIPSYTVWRSLGFGLDFDMSLSSNDAAAAKSVSYLQLQLFSSYDFNLGRLRLAPRGYFIITDSQNAATRVSFKQSQAAPGALLVYSIGSRFDLSLETFVASLGSKAVTSHFYADVFLLWKRASDKGISWGGGLKTQSYSTDSVSGAQRKFDQTIAYGVALF